MFDHDDEDSVNPEELAIYHKGQEIYNLTEKITDLIPDSETMLYSYREYMLEDASQLTVKVAGAEAADLYDLRMENAVLIRKAARDLVAHCSALENMGFAQMAYLNLIREAIEEYRILFIDWVKTFDQWNYIRDQWGLFNPPGVDGDDPEDKND
ncbi:hypothetical protein LVD15_17195 [Fulvivirga maritima]|uniref:hypothetical protein n=1 Tax=Fulvivirga maritima TaxID=2904247 RepID=UPI001F2AD878|nr:hypothetical protein [Fulvivirga maritima]UII25037.1 hypothetical protein LVD15_17195 [Fulvivirga maritima]